MEHVFIHIGHRRWCMCCDLFQSHKAGGFFGKPGDCPNNVPAAAKNRSSQVVMMHEIETEKSSR